MIVESPAKATTIEKYLGKDYKVVSSFGHIRDLPKSKMGIDIDNNYEPQYIISRDKSKVAKELKAEAKKADEVIMASDEDREGEAIAWHTANILGLDSDKTKRIVFHEITEEAIKEAIENPRTVSMTLVDAQQARRILDRLVGYELSPLLWRKVRRGLSAGRVQSVAVRLIVERENEIKDFSQIKSYKVTAELESDGKGFDAKLPRNVSDEAEARSFVQQVAKNDLKIADIVMKPQSRKAPPPFTTSTLQQAAASRLKMSVKQTMMLAQRLYEAGHITYMRTDSTNLSSTATSAIKKYVKTEFGDEYLGEKREYAKSKGAQEAHEAIRPTNVYTETAGNDERQKRLYDLIRNRTVASQMAAAKLQKTEAKIDVGGSDKQLVATGMQIDFPGFLAMDPQSSIKETILPKLEVGDEPVFKSIEATEAFKKPPHRYSEATLVRQLEKLGIGRPSTYAPTISTIQDRGYVEKGDIEGIKTKLKRLKIAVGSELVEEEFEEFFGSDKNKLYPTEIGTLVNGFLTEHFERILDYDFTADVEKQFDKIADGEMKWQEMINEFYKPFHSRLEEIDEKVSKKDTGSIKELGPHPETGEMVYARFARFGPVLQIGEAESKEDKPKFAPFPKGKTIENVTMADAEPMLKLPRQIGKTEDGREIEASIGRYGPYIKIGDKYISVSFNDVFDADTDKALELQKESQNSKKKSELKVFEGTDISVKTGRFGPYVTDGKLNASIPKSIDPDEIDLEKAKELLEKKAARNAKK